MYDLISIGDPTIDTFLKIHDAHVACKLNRKDCQICIDYANKIPVDEFFRFPAGNMPNNAIGSVKLGLKTAVYGVIGQDSDGNWIKKELKKEGVETKFLRTDPKRPTNSSTVLVFQTERTIFVWHETRDYQLPALPQAKWVYLTSSGPMGEHLERLHREILGYLKSHEVRLAFNPGTHQLAMGVDPLRPFLERAEILLLNKEEAQQLTGRDTADIKTLLRALQDLGPELAVITDGPSGSYSFDGSNYFACGILDMPVVERTGAGDSYSTGFIAARFHGLDIPEAMRWGSFNSAHVVGKFGGILGLIDQKKMLQTSLDHPELKVRKI